MLGRIFKFVAGMIVGFLALPVAAGLALTIVVLVVIGLGEPTPDRSAGSRAAFWTMGGNFVASLVIRAGATPLVSAEHSWPNGERSREDASPTAK